MPPLLERNRNRFSEMRLSSSKRPNLTLSQGLFLRLSKRTQAPSKWNTAVGSDEGSNKKEIFLYRVPADHKSMPERSKPDMVTLPAISEHAPPGQPGMESIT